MVCLKKIILGVSFFLFGLVISLFSLSTTVFAQEGVQSQSDAIRDFYFNFDNYKQAISGTAQGQVNFEGWAFKGGSNVIAGTSCLINGRCFPDNQGGAISFVSTLTASLFQSPVNLNQYLAYLQLKNPLVKTAYATTGIQALTPIIGLWEISRNLAYLLFIVIFVAVGFMIMFRSRLNPQTLVSIQLALPKIVVSLILVTFSFAIMALIIDISELAVRLIANIYKNFLQDPSQFDSWLEQITGKKEVSGVLQNIFTLMSALGQTSRSQIGTAIGDLIGGIGAGLWDLLNALGASGSLAELILSIAVISALFKTFFALLTSYVSIIISVIFSPFAFLFSAFPSGQSTPFSLVKSVLANALVFPATLGFLFIGAIIQGQGAGAWQISPAKAPQFTDPNVWLPFGLSGLQQTTVGALVPNLIAFGIILAVPRIPEIIKEALQTKESTALAAAGESFRSAMANIPLVGGLMR